MSATVAVDVRVLVTGPLNPFGAAVAKALAADGHEVRAFGVPAGTDPFHGQGGIRVFPGDIALGGSVEPVAAECQVLVHCANLDAAGDDRSAHAVHIDSGTRYARYSAERELVSAFIALFPAQAARAYEQPLRNAEAHVVGTRKIVPHHVLRPATPADAANQVRAMVARLAPSVAA